MACKLSNYSYNKLHSELFQHIEIQGNIIFVTSYDTILVPYQTVGLKNSFEKKSN